MGAISAMKDRLTIKKVGENYNLNREMKEILTVEELDRRILELEKSEKHINNEIEKGKNAIVNMKDELGRVTRNKNMLLEVKEKGFAEFDI